MPGTCTNLYFSLQCLQERVIFIGERVLTRDDLVEEMYKDELEVWFEISFVQVKKLCHQYFFYPIVGIV